MSSKEELLGLLRAWRTVKDATWPHLFATMERDAREWPTMSPQALQSCVDRYLQEANAASFDVRLFWKLGSGFRFAGANRCLAEDAGLASTALMLGLDDFDKRLSWTLQAAKFRKDDKEVVANGQPKLNIVERISMPGGMQWLRTDKAPIMLAGRGVGLFGMFDVVDQQTAVRLALKAS